MRPWSDSDQRCWFLLGSCADNATIAGHGIVHFGYGINDTVNSTLNLLLPDTVEHPSERTLSSSTAASWPSYMGKQCPLSPRKVMQLQKEPPTDSSVPAGWHPDPEQPGVLRWWDGTAWTEQRQAPRPEHGKKGTLVHWLIPSGRSGWAVAAGYLGLFSVLIVFAPLALVCGLMALRHIRRRPDLGGRGRAWFGTVLGGLGSVLLVGFIWAT